MKRSGFKRKTIERVRTVHQPIPPEHRRQATMAPATTTPVVVEKEPPARSEAYRRLVAALPCAYCGKVGRSQHAHENEGKAKGMKLDDRRAMPLCADEPGALGCHTLFDQYRLVPGGRAAHVALGRKWAAQTRQQILAAGQWPKALPLMGAIALTGEAAAVALAQAMDVANRDGEAAALMWVEPDGQIHGQVIRADEMKGGPDGHE